MLYSSFYFALISQKKNVKNGKEAIFTFVWYTVMLKLI